MSQIPDAISVVIPTYNRAHLIKESLQSVLDQTLQPYEIIVVDDFSTDNTEEVVNSLNSPLIKYLKNERKKGANGARNTGILMAKGEYIAFHDSDDIWLPEKLRLQSEIITENIELCFCSLVKESGSKKGEIFPYKYLDSNKIKDLLRLHNWISTQTILIKWTLARKQLFDENLKRFQDWDFVLRCSREENTIHLHQPLVVQRLSGDSITKNSSHLEAHRSIFNKYPGLANFGIYNKVISQEIKFQENKSINNWVFLLVLKFFRKINYIFRKNTGF